MLVPHVTLFVLGVFKFNLYFSRKIWLFAFISKTFFMKSRFKLLIVLYIFQYTRILFAASSCYIFLTFLAVLHRSFHSHSEEILELAYVNFQFYLVTFYLRTSLKWEFLANETKYFKFYFRSWFA